MAGRRSSDSQRNVSRPPSRHGGRWLSGTVNDTLYAARIASVTAGTGTSRALHTSGVTTPDRESCHHDVGEDQATRR